MDDKITTADCESVKSRVFTKIRDVSPLTTIGVVIYLSISMKRLRLATQYILFILNSMATTGAANNFVLNITELQNTVTTATGLSPFDTLSEQIGQIQQMVIFDEKRIAVNTISAYNTTPIQVTDAINIGPTGGLSVGGATVNTGTGINGPTGPTGPATTYTPVSSKWVIPAPTNVTDAINRIASLVYTLNGNQPIP